MRTRILLVVFAGAVVAWLPTMASAQSGESLGACWIDFTAGTEDATECIGDVTEADCADFCSNCNWDQNTDCTELDVPWQGSCFFDDIPPGGGCWLWAVEGGSDSAEFHCEQTFGGAWSDDLVCGGAPVPALPKLAYAALALVLLAGSLTLLTIYSRS